MPIFIQVTEEGGSEDAVASGYMDIPMMVAAISVLVRQENFWRALVDILKQYSSPTTVWDEFEDFARFMKNDYIAELDGEAKKYCIEISKILKR